MAEYTFVSPPWLEDQDADTIQQRMMEELPADIDSEEGGFPFDFTMPTALEKAEMLQFELQETVKIMFWQFAYGVYLDYHAAAAGLERKAASQATGYVKVTGTAGTAIPSGYRFAVPADGDAAAIEFETTEESEIGSDGTATIPVRAVEAGVSGNVTAGTISIMASNTINGITEITNESAMSGGTATEDDDSLRERIADYYTGVTLSFVGNDADYKRWALEVNGVTSAFVVPEWDGPGTVKIILLTEDSSGSTIPAPEAILTAVYNHIVSPDDRSERLAPIGATVTCEAPNTLGIKISFDLYMESGEDSTALTELIKKNIISYLENTKSESVVKYAEIGAIIVRTDGVYDYDNLTVNGGEDNISIRDEYYPALESITVNSVTEV